MANTLWAFCCLSALCLAAADTPGTPAGALGASEDVESVVPPQREQGDSLAGGDVIPLLSQFTNQDPLEGAPPGVTGASVDVESVVPPQREQGDSLAGDDVIPLLSQFTGQDPLEEEPSDEADGSRQKRTFFCKKCGGKKRGGFGFGYGGGGKKRRGGGYRRVVVPVQVVPVYYQPRRQYCDPCSRGGYHPQGGWGGGGGSYAESFSYSRAYSSGKRK